MRTFVCDMMVMIGYVLLTPRHGRLDSSVLTLSVPAVNRDIQRAFCYLNSSEKSKRDISVIQVSLLYADRDLAIPRSPPAGYRLVNRRQAPV